MKAFDKPLVLNNAPGSLAGPALQLVRFRQGHDDAEEFFGQYSQSHWRGTAPPGVTKSLLHEMANVLHPYGLDLQAREETGDGHRS